MEIKLYIQMLQKNWWFIVLTSMIAFATSLSVSYLTPPQYSVMARFIIIPSASITDSGDIVNSLDTLDRRSVVATYAEIMNSGRVLENASALLGVDSDTLQNEYKVQAVDLPDSSVLELSVTGPDPYFVAQLANAIGYQSIAFTRSLNLFYELNILDEARPAEKPISPVPLRDGIVAFVIGVALGVILAVLSEQIKIPIDAYHQRLRLDGDTGTYNAKYFTRVLNDALIRRPDDIVTIGIIEAAGISDYIETLPLSGLQLLLVKITETLQKELRGNDIIARWNDTSFIVLLPSTDGAAASRTFDRIYQALLQPFNLNSYNVTVNFDPHIGAAVSSNTLTAKELIQKAQESLDQSHQYTVKPIYVWQLKSPFWVQENHNN